MLLGCTLALASPAHAEVASEAAIKTAYLYNFAKFTEWPSAAFINSTAPLNLCIIGRSELGGQVSSLEGKSAQGHDISIKRINSLNEGNECHILLVANIERRQLSDLTHSLSKTPILTVSDLEGFASMGGMLGLITVDERVQFEANPDAARKAGLKISSQLLSLARIAKETSR